jgi:spore coat protein U-like protein
MRILNPGRLFALICLLAAWTGLEGARTPASATPMFNCTVSQAFFNFGAIDVTSGNPSISASPNISCANAPGPKVFVCINKQTLKMLGYPSGTLSFDITPLSVSLPPNGGSLNIVGTISANQRNMDAGSYSTPNFNGNLQIVYSATGCATAPIPLTDLVTATALVVSTCGVTTNDLSFGSATDLNNERSGQTTIQVRCTLSTPYTVALGGGNSNATDPQQRKMTQTGGANTITYGLYYQDQNGKMIPWGSSPGFSGNTSTGFPDITVFGHVPKQPAPAAGNYSDTIVVTVAW